MAQRFVDKEEVKLKTHRHGYIDATGRRLEPGEEILHACTDSGMSTNNSCFFRGAIQSVSPVA